MRNFLCLMNQKEKNMRFSEKNIFGDAIRLLIFIILFMNFVSVHALEKFYNYYDKGLEFMEKKDWLRAIGEFKSAISLEFEDSKMKRTYGTRFIKYFPHREMGICYYNLGEYDNAMGELQLSMAYKKSKRAKAFIDKMSYDGRPLDLKDETVIAEIEKTREKEKEEEQRKAEEEKLKKLKEEAEKEEKKKKQDEEKKEDLAMVELPSEIETSVEPDISTTKVPVGALTYDPDKVTQVGSRLAIAVLPFQANENAKNLEDSVTEKMITQLVNLRRFRVIERGAIEEVMNELSFNLSGMVDEETAVELGKVIGVDVIIMGSINVEIGYCKVNARGINVETAETIVAKDASSGNTNIENIEKLVERVAIKIYNDMPLVEGYVVNVEPDLIYIDIGTDLGVRKGTKCVAFREGETITHPITKEPLQKKVKKLGEVIVVQVQEKMASARIIVSEGSIDIGDKVVVK